MKILSPSISSVDSSVPSHMPTQLWLVAQREVDQLVAIVATDSNYSIQEISEDYYDELVERSTSAEKGVVRIGGSIISFVDDEYMCHVPIPLLDHLNCYYSRTCHTLK